MGNKRDARTQHEPTKHCRRSNFGRYGRYLGGGHVGLARPGFVDGADLDTERCWYAHTGGRRLDGPGQPGAACLATTAGKDHEDDGPGYAGTVGLTTNTGKQQDSRPGCRGIAGAAIIAAWQDGGGQPPPNVRTNDPAGDRHRRRAGRPGLGSRLGREHGGCQRQAGIASAADAGRQWPGCRPGNQGNCGIIFALVAMPQRRGG